MSTNYCLYCMDCNESFGWVGFREETANNILADIPRLAILFEAVNLCQSDIDIQIDGVTIFPLNWFQNHKDHNVVVVDENQLLDLQTDHSSEEPEEQHTDLVEAEEEGDQSR